MKFTLDPAEQVRLRLKQSVLRARRDPVEFVKWVGRQEGDRPIQVSAAHAEWHRALSEHKKVVLFAPVNHGKSSNITRWRVLWEMGRRPDIRIGIISATQGAVPTKFLSAIRQDIEQNKWLRVIFPALKRQLKGQKMWNDRGIIIERVLPLPDPTVQVFGLHGQILGSRLDLIIIDDICSLANTLTEYSRERMWEWISGEVFSRQPFDQSGRVWALGHVWHKDDALHRMAKTPGFKKLLYSAFVPDGDGGEKPLIPEMWTLEALKRREVELGRFAPHMLRNILPAYDEARIKQSSIDRCLARGRGLGMLERWNPADSPTFTGVDLSVASGAKGDLACLFTITVLPDGSRQVLDVRSGRWTGPKILSELVDVHRRYGSLIMVENNAAQDYLIQFAGELTTLPLKRHTTGMNKYSMAFGIESLGTEMDQGRWIIPCDEDQVPSDEVAAWLRECQAYVPSEHTGDRLIASWISRECARQAGYSAGAWTYEDDYAYMDVDTLSR
jgi:hypothetical protein